MLLMYVKCHEGFSSLYLVCSRKGLLSMSYFFKVLQRYFRNKMYPSHNFALTVHGSSITMFIFIFKYRVVGPNEKNLSFQLCLSIEQL